MKNFICISLVFILLLGLDACCTLVPPAITVTNTQITSPNTGAITVSSGSCPAITGYQWSNGATSPTITGLSASFSPYSVTPTYTLGSISWSGTPLSPYYVLCDVTWVPITTSSPNIVELIPGASGMGAISKSGIGSTAGYNASAYSVNTLPSGANGILEFQVGTVPLSAPTINTHTNSHPPYDDFVIGFTPQYVTDNPIGTTAIQYGLHFTYTTSLIRNPNNHQFRYLTSRAVKLFVNGVDGATICTYNQNDVFDMVKTGNAITFKRNHTPINYTYYIGSILYTSPYTINVSSTQNLIVDLAASRVGMNLIYARTSFGNVVDNDYAELSKTLDGSFYVAHTTLGIRYKEKYNNKTLNYSIYDSRRNAISSGTPNNTLLNGNGYNYLRLPLSSSSFINGRFYVLEVTDTKGEVYKLRFQYYSN